MRFKLTSVLGKALDAARDALADLDKDQVPAKLRPVVAHAGDLTPDLARRLLRELDRIEWLRTRALEQWPDADSAGAGPDRASVLFLARPDGWAAELVGVIGDALASAGAGREQEAAGDRDGLVKDRDAWKAKARDLQKKLDTSAAERARAEKALRAPARAASAEGAKASAAQRRAAQAHEAEVEELRRRIKDLEDEIKKRGDDARRLRRAASDAEARAAEARTGPGWLGSDPLDLARHLDDLMARARRLSTPDPGPPPAAERLQLPVGVGPDSAEAIDAVARAGGTVAVIVDGYNAGLAFGPGTAAKVRPRLEPHLRRLRSLGGPAMTVTVVWDSSLDLPGSRRPGGIDVVFAPVGVEADDVVVEIAAASPHRCVVVTNDREVRERAERVGALALWSDALVDWARKRG